MPLISPRSLYTRLRLIAAILIISALSTPAVFADTDLDADVLEAFQRYSPSKYPDVDAIRARLDGFYDDPKKGQIRAVVSNVKGILHELEFVRAENTDGDSITAALFGKTNQPCFDVIMTDADGQSWYIQLKARKSPPDMAKWQARCGADSGQMFVTQELAQQAGLQGSGFSNTDLTARVEDFIDQLMPRGYVASY